KQTSHRQRGRVRFTPQGGLREWASACPPCATSGLMHRRKPRLSLDYRIRNGEQPVRQSEPEHAGGLCIDDQLELVRLYDGQIRGLRALEDAAGVKADLTKPIHNVGSVADQPADFGMFTQTIYRRKPVERRQLGELDTPAVQKRRRADEDGIGSLATHR